MTALRLLAAALGFCALEGLLFHSGRYASVLSPDSSTGFFETFFANERNRQRVGPQILGIGDSRMALDPRLANALRAETGFTFGRAAVPGATPRVWYYLLRDLDPERNRYAAIVIGVDNYDDHGSPEDLADRALDTRLLAARLRLSDLLDYSGGFRTWETRLSAARSILLRGSVWGADFQDLLRNPAARFKAADDSHRLSWQWQYAYLPPDSTMEDVQPDFVHRTAVVPPAHTEAEKQGILRRLFGEFPPDDGRMREYNREWFGRIRDLYAGTRTAVIFFRLPRAPYIRPDYPRANPQSVLRNLTGVRLLDERLLDGIEHPELFRDDMHLNRQGTERLTPVLAREVVRTLRR